jgi:hypothetical protein
MKASAEHLQSLVIEKHSDVRERLESLVTAIASQNVSEVQAANAQLSKSLHRLSDVLATEDKPQWLNQLLAHVDNYKNNHANGPATWRPHLLTIIQLWSVVHNHAWFSSDTAPPLDVDKIIEDAKAEFNVDEIFTKTVSALEALAACDELDSKKACADLERLISILRHSQRGSFTAQITSWRFARRFVANVIACYIKESKVTGPLVKAFEQTAKELDVALDQTKDQIGQRVLELATAGFQSGGLENITALDIKALPDLRSSTDGSGSDHT